MLPDYSIDVNRQAMPDYIFLLLIIINAKNQPETENRIITSLNTDQKPRMELLQ